MNFWLCFSFLFRQSLPLSPGGGHFRSKIWVNRREGERGEEQRRRRIMFCSGFQLRTLSTMPALTRSRHATPLSHSVWVYFPSAVHPCPSWCKENTATYTFSLGASAAEQSPVCSEANQPNSSIWHVFVPRDGKDFVSSLESAQECMNLREQGLGPSSKHRHTGLLPHWFQRVRAGRKKGHRDSSKHQASGPVRREAVLWTFLGPPYKPNPMELGLGFLFILKSQNIFLKLKNK